MRLSPASRVQEKDIDNAPIVTLEDLEKYCEDTYSSLLYLTLECLGVRNVTADHAASHIGACVSSD